MYYKVWAIINYAWMRNLNLSHPLLDDIARHRWYTAYMGLYWQILSGPIEAMDHLPSAFWFISCHILHYFNVRGQFFKWILDIGIFTNVNKIGIMIKWNGYLTCIWSRKTCFPKPFITNHTNHVEMLTQLNFKNNIKQTAKRISVP